ncbi:Pentatricopeptide repeat [Dillenia turbinata]|uniref:Pentatricopeptide repeat n=1 Tax=Dillenia turbinata TaxID=194707 RepID=A0AAN8V0T4_9MAGN
MTRSLLSLLRSPKTKSQIFQIHAQLITTNYISNPNYTATFITSIASLDFPNTNYIDLVFTHVHNPGTCIYNTIIKTHAQHSNPKHGFELFRKMKRKGLFGDNYTYPFVLKACGLMLGLWEGREVHCEVVKCGFESNLFVVNSLIGFYGGFGEMGLARTVFDGFSGKDLVSWNVILGGYVRCGDMVEAQSLFDEMPERNVISWSIMIDGYCKKRGDVARARVLFDNMPVRDLVSLNSMIEGYAKVGKMEDARYIFDQMPEKNVISWSIIIDGYVQHGNPKEALSLFRQMLDRRTKPDKVAMVGALMACAQLGALHQGRWMHMYMKRERIKMDIIVQTALMDMYIKCGSLDEARLLFNSMLERNVISWNVMIAGLGMNGLGKEALHYFKQMEVEGVLMDDLIFLSVLSACSHAGLVTEGRSVFDSMRSVYKVEPKVEHYGCLVDLLGRAGRLDEAKKVIETMPMTPNPSLWGSLLLASHTNRDVHLAELVAERLGELKADDAGVCILMSNIYADLGMWEDTHRMRNLMGQRNMRKECGRSVIEVDGGIHEFLSGENSHRKIEEMRLIISSLLEMAKSTA